MSDDYAVFDGRFPVLSHDKCQTMIQERDAEIARLRAERNNASAFTAKAYQHEIQYLKADADRLRKQVTRLRQQRDGWRTTACASAGAAQRAVAAEIAKDQDAELDAIDAEAK